MENRFLYEELNGARRMGLQLPEVPDYVQDNLGSSFGVRDYQKEALGRFIHCYTNDFVGKEFPLHFLYNMATGSGKTLVMAGFVLYLYKQGYRNFLFFVNSNNIIQKTIENFTATGTRKYLFADSISFGGKTVAVQTVRNFEDANPNNINICFTTIQQLHADLHNEKENALTFEDFKGKDIVLLSDESHHIQVASRQGTLGGGLEKPTWENTVEQIFKQNERNILLEFTATMDDFRHPAIRRKYENKVIYKYDLREFRNDGYSKDPALFSTDVNKKDRILQAIILSQYRQEVATANKIPLKPVILFKAQKTIEQSKENHTLFNRIIEELSVSDIEQVKSRCRQPAMVKAFEFFAREKITNTTLVKKLKDGFAPNRCYDVNEENLDKKSLKDSTRAELLRQQSVLNSLEDKGNRYRAIFAVQKLNEGWDVLNLFDIVRMYETRDGKAGKPGPTTISEAQLIGRGARYYPFAVSTEQERFKRKFDKNLESDLRILEELHYHSHNESRYIAEITKALTEVGLFDEKEKEVEMKLKADFKDKRFYKTGLVWRNQRVPAEFKKGEVLSQLPSKNKNILFKLHTGAGDEISIFGADKALLKQKVEMASQDIALAEIEAHVIRKALERYSFFDFKNLVKYFSDLQSRDTFVTAKEYLGGFSITIEGDKAAVKNLTNNILFGAVCQLLETIEREIKANTSEFKGTEEFVAEKFSDVFGDKKIKVKLGSEREDGQWDYIADKDWYVFDSFYGTSEEKDFVSLIDRMVANLRQDYKEIYLVRNERALKLFNFSNGTAFEPDYVLFANDKNDTDVVFQVFVEPKGRHLMEFDKWKDDFLTKLTEKNKAKYFQLSNRKYRVVGVPFYNHETENAFKDNLVELLK